MTVRELIVQLQRENADAVVYDTDGHPIIGLSHDDPECGCCDPSQTVYIEAEF